MTKPSTQITPAPRATRATATPRNTRGGFALDIKQYKPDMKQSMTNRVAHYLDWSAAHYPKQFTAYNIVLKAIHGYAKTPRLDSDEVEGLRRAMSRVKLILFREYGRELVSQPGVGVRATTDDADTLLVALPKKVMRVRSAQKAMAETASIIDPSKVPDTAEMKPWKAWFTRSVKDAIKTLTSPEFQQKLLPPSAAEAEAEATRVPKAEKK